MDKRLELLESIIQLIEERQRYQKKLQEGCKGKEKDTVLKRISELNGFISVNQEKIKELEGERS